MDVGPTAIYIITDAYRMRFRRVVTWGNGLAVRLPSALVKALKIKAGDEIEVHIAGRREMRVGSKRGSDEILKQLRSYRGRLPADFKFDRDLANAR